MTIDPRWSFWLSITLSVLGFLSGAGTLFAGLGLSATVVTALLSGFGLLVGIGNAVNAVLAAIPSKDSKTGFYLAPKDPPAK